MAIFELPGAVPGKARPRVSGRVAYMPKPYKEWQRQAVASLTLQKPLNWQPPQPARVTVKLCGKGHRSDIDNAAGSLLDALVMAGILQNDSPKHVAQLSITHDTTCKFPLALVEVLCLSRE